MTTKKDRLGDAVALTASVVIKLSQIAIHTYRNVFKLVQMPLEFVVDEDEGLGVSRTTIFLSPPKSAAPGQLRLHCGRLRRVGGAVAAGVSPTLAPTAFQGRDLPCWIDVTMPRDVPGGLYELELVVSPTGDVHTYQLYFGRPRATG